MENALDAIVKRHEQTQRKYFRWGTVFAIPDICEYLEEHSLQYAIRLPANEILKQEIGCLLTRSVGRPSKEPEIFHAGFMSNASCCESSDCDAVWHKTAHQGKRR